MRYFDVFNADADGICALHQLRLADPVDSILVTGLKREIALLKSVPAESGDVVTALDISIERNRAVLAGLLERGVVVHYFDHHEAGASGIPKHDALLAVIDTRGETCTSALIDRYLGGRFRAWAVVGAFGDNQPEVAMRLAAAMMASPPSETARASKPRPQRKAASDSAASCRASATITSNGSHCSPNV